MDINIQPKQSSMSASTVSAMITLTTEEIVVNTSTNAADDYTLSQYKEAQKELEEMLSAAYDIGLVLCSIRNGYSNKRGNSRYFTEVDKQWLLK